MKFEMVSDGGANVSVMEVSPVQVPVWEEAFQIELADLFDMDTAETALPVLDAAVRRFYDAPDALRPLLHPADWRGLKGNRQLIQRMRDWMATYPGATISGADDVVPAAS